MRRSSKAGSEAAGGGGPKFPPIRSASGVSIDSTLFGNELAPDAELALIAREQEAADEKAAARALNANPFVVPDKEDVFIMRKMEKQLKLEERSRMHGCSVADKNTFTSRLIYPSSGKYLEGGREPGARAGGLNILNKAHETARANQAIVNGGPTAGRSGMQLATSGTKSSNTSSRRMEKESMHGFISKKREIFLVQMQLETKQEEIRRLENDTYTREERVRNNEAMLEEDALRFDAFLKENDLKVQEAVKRADAESKAKIEKIHEIKRLTGEIETLGSQLSKFEEQLDNCKKYKTFIDGLTPQEFFDEQKRLNVLRKERKLREWQAEVEEIQQIKEYAAERLEKANNEYNTAVSQQAFERAEAEIREAKGALEVALKIEEPPRPAEEEEEDQEEEIPEIYFTDPEQMLQKYKEMEQKNLFLIQNNQEMEEILDDLSIRSEKSRKEMHERISALQVQEDALDLEIAAETELVEALSRRCSAKQEDRVGTAKPTRLSDDGLVAAVRGVYTHTGFEQDNSVGVLTMLTNIENKVEEYLRIVNSMPADFVDVAEKQCEKERRKGQRAEKIEEQRLEREARLRVALERAKAPIKKREGKPDMFRSQPFTKKETAQEFNADELEKEELNSFLARQE